MISSTSSIAPEERDAVHANVSLSRLPGFRFAPTDELLVDYYLKKKIEGTDSHFRYIIPEIDVWKYEPCDLPAFFSEGHGKDGFFFTRPKYKDANSTRRDRLTHQGYYKVTGDERDIRAEESKAVIGKKIILTFHEGRAPKAKKSDWVIHEYYYCTQTEVGSKPTKQMDLVLCRLKNKSASYKKPKVDPTRGELADSGANPEDAQAAAASNVIAEPVEHPGCNELGHVNSSESSDGSYPINWKDILNFVYGDVETGCRKVSDFDDPAASDLVQELCSALGEIPNSTSQLQQPPQTPQPHQPPHPHQPQDYYSTTHQPPLHTTQDYYPSTHQPPEYIVSTNDPNEPVSKPNGVQDLATDEMIPEDCFHPDEFMGLPFDPSQDCFHPDEFMGLPFDLSQDYLLPSPMNMELGDGVQMKQRCLFPEAVVWRPRLSCQQNCKLSSAKLSFNIVLSSSKVMYLNEIVFNHHSFVSIHWELLREESDCKAVSQDKVREAAELHCSSSAPKENKNRVFEAYSFEAGIYRVLSLKHLLKTLIKSPRWGMVLLLGYQVLVLASYAGFRSTVVYSGNGVIQDMPQHGCWSPKYITITRHQMVMYWLLVLKFEVPSLME